MPVTPLITVSVVPEVLPVNVAVLTALMSAPAGIFVPASSSPTPSVPPVTAVVTVNTVPAVEPLPLLIIPLNVIPVLVNDGLAIVPVAAGQLFFQLVVPTSTHVPAAVSVRYFFIHTLFNVDVATTA